MDDDMEKDSEEKKRDHSRDLIKGWKRNLWGKSFKTGPPNNQRQT
jgi:hypothetical protein